MPAPAKGFGGTGQAFDRAQLIAQVDRRDNTQKHAEKHRVNEKLVRVGGRDPPPFKLDAQRAMHTLDIEHDKIVIAKVHRCDPVHLAAQPGDEDAARIIVPQHAVFIRQRTIGPGHHEIERPRPRLYRHGHRLGIGCGADRQHDQFQLAQDRVGHLTGDAFEMSLGKDHHNDQLQKHHW